MSHLPPERHPNPTVDGGETRGRLLVKAARLFREKGYSASTTRELAQALGIQKASLYHHISSKEDLLYSLCVESLARTREAVETAIAGIDDPLDRVRRLVLAHVGNMLGDRDKQAMFLELRSLEGQRRAAVIEMRDQYEELVRSTIADAQTAGVLRADIGSKILTLALLNLMNWTIVWYEPDRGLTAEEIGATLLDIYLKGSLPEGKDGGHV